MTATPNIQHIVDRLNIAYPGRLRYEFYNRRRIGGSQRWSQHAGSEPDRGWWGNAVDIFDPDDFHDSAQLDLVHQFLDANRERLNIRVLLWKVPNHHNHIHCDTWPKMRDDGGYIPPPQGPLVTINEDGTRSDTFEEVEDVAQFTEEEAEALRQMVANMEAENSNPSWVTWAIRMIRRERDLPLHEPAAGGLVLPADVRISEIP